MTERIRDLTSAELALFAKVIARLERIEDGGDVRELVFDDIVQLTRSDFGASYVWSKQANRFEDGIIYNMDAANIKRYEEWYQFRDPHTQQLRMKRRATLVEEVTPGPELRQTEFYNDFLKRDGLHNGINMFLFDGDSDLGDFRLWRTEQHEMFGSRETTLLETLAPYLRRALIRFHGRFDRLTPREKEIALLVAKGCRDRDIADVLGISFATVRTHINKAMEKKGCANRAELAAMIR